MGSPVAHIPVRCFGRIANITAANCPMDIWCRGTIYVFDNEPFKLQIASTNALDTAIPIYIHGLNEDYQSKGAIVILNGQNPVSVSGVWTRLYFAQNADTGKTAVGTIYIAKTGTWTGGVPDTIGNTRMMIEPDLQNSAACIATVPKGYHADIISVSASLIPKSATNVYARIGIFTGGRNKTMTCKAYFGLCTQGTSNVIIPVTCTNEQLEEDTNITMRLMNVSSNDSEVAAAMELKLYKNG